MPPITTKQEVKINYGKEDHYLTIDKVYEDIRSIYNKYNKSKQTKNDNYLTSITIQYTDNNIPEKIEFRYYVPKNLADAASYSLIEIKNLIVDEG